MPREKGRPGHGVIRVDSDIGQKHKKIAGLIPVVEHLRKCLDSQPDYIGLSQWLDGGQDELVLDILDSSVDSLVRISMLFRAVLESPTELHEMSIHYYKAWTPPEVERIREVELTRGYVAKVDDSDYVNVTRYQWEASLDLSPVAQRKIQGEGRTYTVEFMHDAIMNPPKGTRVEHANGDGLDNRRENLRIVEITAAEDNVNRDASICLPIEP